MNLAVEQVNARDIEGRRKRSILRRILIQDDTGPTGFIRSVTVWRVLVQQLLILKSTL